MRTFFVGAGVLAVLAAVPPMTTDKIPAAGGDIEITPIMHASVQVEHAGKVIHIDPWRKGDYSKAKQADLILVTDTPDHHFDLEAIRMLRKSGAPVLMPAAGKDKLADGTVIANRERKTVAGVSVEAIPMYDLKPGEPFHKKGVGNGYIITAGGKRLYFAGVTECVPEIQALKNIDVAFIPMNLPQGRMTPSAAAECVKIFKPTVVYPYHYSGGDGKVDGFKEALKGEAIEVRLAEWYPR